MAATRTPRPLSAEQMLEDLKNVSQNDVVFTSIPPGIAAKPKDKGVDKEVDRIATDSAKLVSAYNNLKVSHQNELPHVIDQVKQHITDLESVLSRSDDT